MDLRGMEMITSFISIQGSIGAGKSTFMEILGERIERTRQNGLSEDHLSDDDPERDYYILVSEPLGKWTEPILKPKGIGGEASSMLSDYYEKPKKRKFRFQMFTFLTRLEELIETLAKIPPNGKGRRIHIISERSLRADRLFYETNNQTYGGPESETIVYERLFQLNCGNLLKHEHLMLYIPTPPDTCQKRIYKRGRPGESEKPINRAYMILLEENHIKMTASFKEENGSDSVVQLDRLNSDMTREEMSEFVEEVMNQKISPFVSRNHHLVC